MLFIGFNFVLKSDSKLTSIGYTTKKELTNCRITLPSCHLTHRFEF